MKAFMWFHIIDLSQFLSVIKYLSLKSAECIHNSVPYWFTLIIGSYLDMILWAE